VGHIDGVLAWHVMPNSPAGVMRAFVTGDHHPCISMARKFRSIDVPTSSAFGLWSQAFNYGIDRGGQQFDTQLGYPPAESLLPLKTISALLAAIPFIGLVHLRAPAERHAPVHFSIFLSVSFVLYSFQFSGT